ncbi:MAG: KpsF/GutQ family sugar-phosphate isomerase [Alloprevotella sp.]|nr:KpsF/GutQ family sugar-phosphate isomerase [Alloprevotella sp.]MBR6338707.1 KpsF/GutQ family sugar-phosphate isomerase [Alloprevotella sp.]
MLNQIALARQCLRDEAEAISGLIDQIDEQFESAVAYIASCQGKLIVTGVGKSGLIGAKIAATMSSMGTPSFFVSPLDVFHGDLGVIASDDVVLAISNSGETDELLRFIPYLQEMGVPIIAMSGNPNSRLARYATIHICVSVPHEAGPLGLAPTSSTTAALAMGDALACVLADARGFEAKDFAHFHPGGSLGKRLLTTAADVMQASELPVVSPETPMREAIVTMSKGRLGLCVIVEADSVVGIITDGDVRRAIERSGDAFFQSPAKDFMTPNPCRVEPTEKIATVEKILQEKKIHCVLVTDERNRLLGIVDSFRTNV